jgi:hypothetical protein
LAEFFGRAWNSSVDAAGVLLDRAAAARANVADAGIVPPAFGVFHQDRLVGYVGSIPARVWTAGTEEPAYWIKGLMVLPEHRNGPVGFAVAKAAAQRLPLSMSMTVTPAACRLFVALGYRDHGPVPNYLRLLNPGRVVEGLDLDRLGLTGVPGWARSLVRVGQHPGAARLMGAAAAIGLGAIAWVGSLPGLALDAEPGTPPEEELDGLWSRSREGLGACVIRDGRYLTSRYGAEHPESDWYRWITVRRSDGLAALAIVRRPGGGDERLGGLRMATLVDLVVSRGDRAAGLAVLRGAEAVARAEKADGLVATMSSPRARALLRRRAYLSIPGNVHFLTREAGRAERRWPDRLEDWWITRGDGQSDGTL